jgi:Prolyl oligopeptidase, N-terminal beta-propeller domain.
MEPVAWCFFSFEGWEVCGDRKNKRWKRWRTFFVMDMTTLKYLPDSLAWVKVSGASWKGNGFYYSRYPTPEKGTELSTKNENHQVYYHKWDITRPGSIGV